MSMFNGIICVAAVAFRWDIAITVLAIISGIGLLLLLSTFPVASYFIYTKTMRRKDDKHWGREPSCLEPEHLQMYSEGEAWQSRCAENKQDIHIVNRDGMNLYGEFYGNCSDSCVIILSGRTESLKYGYYFAIPYWDAGYSVMVLDPRAHGLSDGRYNTAGFEESGDILEWTRYAYEVLGVRSVIFHGICIGAAGGMLAITNESCPDYVKGIITDGMFPNFGESMKNHLIERKKPVKGLYRMINFWAKHYTGHSFDFGPINVIQKLDKPLLMLQSKEDKYSLPEFAEKLYALAGSEQKRLVYFEHGMHSMLRYTDSKRYDESIKSFLGEYLPSASIEKI